MMHMKMRFSGLSPQNPRDQLETSLGNQGGGQASLIPSSFHHANGRVDFTVTGYDFEEIEQAVYQLCEEIGVDIIIAEPTFERWWTVTVKFPSESVERVEGFVVSDFPSQSLDLTPLDSSTTHPANVQVWRVTSDERSLVSAFFDEVADALEGSVLSITELSQ